MASKRAKSAKREAIVRDNDEDRAKLDEREASKKHMWESYEEMMNTYAHQQKALSKRPAWIAPKTRDAEEPHDLTVTHVNHTQDLLRSSTKSAIPANNQTSNEWLEHHSIESMKLTLKTLMDKGQIKRPSVNKETSKLQQQLQFDALDINEFEYKLNLAIESYTNRIKWLLQGSRRIFGVVKGSNVAVVLDSSDANLGFGRLSNYQDALAHLLDEQLSQKNGVYMVSFGTDVMPLWNNCMNVSSRSIEEAKSWVDRLTPSGGSNVLRALHHTIKVKDIDTILLVLGSSPDQTGNAVTSYIDELTVGKGIHIQTVAYDCNNPITHQTLKQLAENSGATYNNYDASNEHEMYTGSDIAQLLNEIQKAQNVINKIKEMREGLLGNALVSVMNEISDEVSKLPQSRFLPGPPGHDQPLRIDMPNFQPSASSDWLQSHGLKATGLDLYQKLSPNAFSFKEEFIPVIKKTVQSQVYEKAMTQFQWHDGTYRNIHVDLTQLYDYQKKLGSSVKVLEKRIDWLSSSSRRIFGTIVEKNVVILLDLSLPNLSYLVHIQHSMRLLLEQQMANKEYFNIITIGKNVNAWRPTMTKPTPETLQSAWRWILDQQCDGSRNVMDALRKAVENDEEQKHHIDVEGIYLFTSGIPDQSQEVIMQYLEEVCCGRDRRVHVILFNVDDYDSNGAIPSRYANITKTAECLRNMSHCTTGRFHWFRETGIIESDDIALVNLEIEKALNFSKKSAMLVDSVKTKYGEDFIRKHVPALPPPNHTFKALPAPNTKPPMSKYGYSHSRQMSDNQENEQEQPKAVTWRPNSAKRPISVQQRPMSAQHAKNVTRKKKTQQEFFFTEDKRGAVGAVYSKYASTKSRSARTKPVKAASIPDREEAITTKDWLRMYSLSKLKLDLNKMVFGPESKVTATNVKVINRVAESKVFSQFPTVSVGGTLRRLQLRPQELLEYERQVEKVLQRYLRRLQWLLGGSRRVFGVAVEKKVAVLIDTSGSMMPYIDELRSELVSLVWEQLFHHRIKFNLIAFSATCTNWQDSLVTPAEDICHEAAQWVSGLVAHGNTCTLDALQMAFADEEVEAIYLLTDGKPDTSTSLVIREVAKLNEDRSVHIHTISFNCEDSTANSFLKMLAAENKGRYHKCHKDFDAQLFAHKLLTEGMQDSDNPPMPEFEGDDLKRIGQEIKTARAFLSQSRQYREITEENQRQLEEQQSARPRQNETTRGLPSSSRYRPMSAKV